MAATMGTSKTKSENPTTAPRGVKKTASEIKRYLESRPNAAETVDGVARWWLTRQRFDDSKSLVHAALEYLVEQGDVRKRKTGGKEVYSRAAVKH